jgi:hypothetical protein
MRLGPRVGDLQILPYRYFALGRGNFRRNEIWIGEDDGSDPDVVC